MLLIHNSTGGRVPRYWRPPYGDSDMRVRSIAKEVSFKKFDGLPILIELQVFGLDTVVWNQE